MKIKVIAASTLLATALTAMSAQDLSITIVPIPDGIGGWSAPFAVSHTLAGAFTDTFHLGSFAQPVLVDSNLSTINMGRAFNIDFSWAQLSNGVTTVHYGFLPEEPGGFEGGDIVPTFFAAGLPLTLSVSGMAATGLLPGDGNPAASYSGNVNFTLAPVPEPTTTAMLLAGLATVGWLSRRRQSWNRE